MEAHSLSSSPEHVEFSTGAKMNFLKALLSVLSLVGYAYKELKTLPIENRQKAIKELSEAVKEAKQTDSTQKLEKFFSSYLL